MPPLMFPRASTKDALVKILAQTLTLRLYSNDHALIPTDVLASFVEAVGSGYAAIPLVTANWTITEGSPSVALYSAYQLFIFTAAAPTPIDTYGYYVTTPGGLVVWAEQFYESRAPVVCGNGQIIRIRPRIGADNLVNPPIEIIP